MDKKNYSEKESIEYIEYGVVFRKKYYNHHNGDVTKYLEIDIGGKQVFLPSWIIKDVAAFLETFNNDSDRWKPKMEVE